MHFISVVSGCPSHDDGSSAECVEEAKPLVSHFIIHARKCLLKGLRTKDNRSVPPLHYDWVFRLCWLCGVTRRLLDDFPQIDFTLNGGIKSYREMKELLDRESLAWVLALTGRDRLHRKLRGVMIGRMVMQNPFVLRHIDEAFYHTPSPRLSRRQIVEDYVNYVEQFLETHRGSGARQ